MSSFDVMFWTIYRELTGMIDETLLRKIFSATIVLSSVDVSLVFKIIWKAVSRKPLEPVPAWISKTTLPAVDA